MSRVQKGMVAGLAATVASSILELVNVMAGPWFHSVPKILSFALRMPDNQIVGWGAHFVAGALLGGLFGVICPKLPNGTAAAKGIMFAIGAWVVMITVLAPMAGLGMFVAQAGFPTLAWMFATHVVFGVVLGTVYAKLAPDGWRQHHPHVVPMT